MTLDTASQAPDALPRILIAARKHSEAVYWRNAIADRHPDAALTMTTIRQAPRAFRGIAWTHIYVVGSMDQTPAEFEQRNTMLQEAMAAQVRFGTIITGQANLEPEPWRT